MAMWLQPPAQLLRCKDISYPVWTWWDKLPLYPAAHSQDPCSSSLGHKSWCFHLRAFCSLPQLPRGSVASWVRKAALQSWAWPPWFKTEVSSSLTHLLHHLQKCFMHRLSQAQRNSFPLCQTKSLKTKNSRVCVSQYPPRWGRFSWWEDSMAAFLFSAWKGVNHRLLQWLCSHSERTLSGDHSFWKPWSNTCRDITLSQTRVRENYLLLC